jgi:hypothetical protein
MHPQISTLLVGPQHHWMVIMGRYKGREFGLKRVWAASSMSRVSMERRTFNRNWHHAPPSESIGSGQCRHSIDVKIAIHAQVEIVQVQISVKGHIWISTVPRRERWSVGTSK